MHALEVWLNSLSLPVIGLIIAGGMWAAAVVGFLLRAPPGKGDNGQEGYVVSAVLGLLALLMGFTFSLAVDRFDTRRVRVLEEANAINTAYLRVQLLSEPHRQRMSGLLIHYVDTRLALASAKPDRAGRALLADNDGTLTALWAATSAAFDDIKGYDFSTSLIDSVNEVIAMDAARKAGRVAHVPTQVLFVLAIYLFATGGVLGHVLTGWRGRLSGALLLLLLAMAMTLILDIDRPNLGGVRESQAPMEALRATLRAQPPPAFDRWRTPQALAASGQPPADPLD